MCWSAAWARWTRVSLPALGTRFHLISTWKLSLSFMPWMVQNRSFHPLAFQNSKQRRGTHTCPVKESPISNEANGNQWASDQKAGRKGEYKPRETASILSLQSPGPWATGFDRCCFICPHNSSLAVPPPRSHNTEAPDETDTTRITFDKIMILCVCLVALKLCVHICPRFLGNHSPVLISGPGAAEGLCFY